MKESYTVKTGSPRPFGATVVPGGVNFAIFSRNASCMHLCIYDKADDGLASFEVSLCPVMHRTGDIWHIEILGLSAGALYAWRADGPFLPQEGYRFNRHKILIDPYAKAITGDFIWEVDAALGYVPGHADGDMSFCTEDDAALMPKCIVVDDEAFDWQGDRPLNLPLRHAVLYEAHVRGLSAHPSSGAKHPGTYQGVVEMIPYLRELGITSLELLPVHEFDYFENKRTNPETGERLKQYWGYSTLAFMAPKGSYAASGALGQQVTEFKTMVRELHKAGIEVILDVVFNHTGEGNEWGPTISFRGLDNPIWYMLEDNKRYYKNFSGCGNTLNCNHPVVRGFILDCLHYWVVDMHVDGFRFDLGSILGRDQRGHLLENPPVIEQIAEDPILRNTKIIAEAWDAGGAYQVGWFPGGRWAEWNDRYRDDLRRFWRGDDGMVGALSTRLTGSSDLYLRDGRKPFHSINYITSHDGFTLRDLVSYNEKHNEANGENNQDGHPANFGWNCGVEGPVADKNVEKLRLRQSKNFLASLLLSLGTPMLTAGDEIGRTQRGNNNAWCQDNELSWMDYALKDRNSELFRFARLLINLRKTHTTFRRPDFFTGKGRSYNSKPDISWYDEKGRVPEWGKLNHQLAARIDGTRADIAADRDDSDFFIMFNSGSTASSFILGPSAEGKEWYRLIDTGRDSPADFMESGQEADLVSQREYTVGPHCLVLLVLRPHRCSFCAED
ncbi:MAG: glycogen debranching protein GlgX [Spirochaetes bacterium]|nr:glycogen debranching protein GlgX [Spirochaetota bacterium]MBU0956717.1 glycogen debranching protein GlgX [Spirochaetota bacterium]